MTRHRIPVRVGPRSVSTRSVYPEAPVASQQAQRKAPAQVQREAPDAQPAAEDSAPVHDVSRENQADTVAWRDRALRLQAEMDNYRKRQRRIAQEEAQVSRDRLLRDVLRVADNLDRTLAAARRSEAPRADSDALREGVELTRDELLRVLADHGLERFDALGEPFDPAWHEAVHVVSARALGVEPGTVVEQVQPGYRARDPARLFRPAQVVVAN